MEGTIAALITGILSSLVSILVTVATLRSKDKALRSSEATKLAELALSDCKELRAELRQLRADLHATDEENAKLRRQLAAAEDTVAELKRKLDITLLALAKTGNSAVVPLLPHEG